MAATLNASNNNKIKVNLTGELNREAPPSNLTYT